MSLPQNIKNVEPVVKLFAETGNSSAEQRLRDLIESATSETFLRPLLASLRGAQESAVTEARKGQLEALWRAAEARRSALDQARQAKEQAREQLTQHDPQFSETLNAEIEYVAATTDDATLQSVLNRISSTNDLQSLQLAVKKLSAVRNDLRYSPTSQSFVDKGLNTPKWQNQMRQIEVAIETRILELRQMRIAASQEPVGEPDAGAGFFASVWTFLKNNWLFVLLAVGILFLLIPLLVSMFRDVVSKPKRAPVPYSSSTAPTYSAPVPQFAPNQSEL